MKPSEVYFSRNRGTWDWTFELKISNYRALWSSDLKFSTKFRISLLYVTQNIFGPFFISTNVALNVGSGSVKHLTQIKKWGVVLYKSRKEFLLAEDGFNLKISGTEFYWPLACIGEPFHPLSGYVNDSTTRAFYQMPIAGTHCDCRTYLGPNEGYIDIDTKHFKGRMTLKPESAAILASRFHDADDV